MQFGETDKQGSQEAHAGTGRAASPKRDDAGKNANFEPYSRHALDALLSLRLHVARVPPPLQEELEAVLQPAASTCSLCGISTNLGYWLQACRSRVHAQLQGSSHAQAAVLPLSPLAQ